MSGIEILSEELIRSETCLLWLCLLIALCAAICAVLFVMGIFIENYAVVFGGVIGIICFGIVGLVCIKSRIYPKEEYIQYKVTVDDNVSLNDFMNKYEIIDVDGKIYTIKEKVE